MRPRRRKNAFEEEEEIKKQTKNAPLCLMILEPKMRLSLSDDFGTKKVQFLLRVPSSSAKKVIRLFLKSRTRTHTSLSLFSLFFSLFCAHLFRRRRRRRRRL